MSGRSSKASWFPRAATALAILACYGTTVLIGLLSLLGVTLAINEGVWAGVIVFAALATAAIAMSYRRHRVIGPTVVAALGLGLILWVMFGSYSRVIELVGFVLLIAAALWDWRAGASRGGAADGVSWIEARDLADHLRREPRPFIIDVRSPDEFTASLGHIETALNIPLGELSERLTEIRAHKKKPVIVVCRTDKRSAAAATLLSAGGFSDVRVLRGGMERWRRDGSTVAGNGPVDRV